MSKIRKTIRRQNKQQIINNKSKKQHRVRFSDTNEIIYNGGEEQEKTGFYETLIFNKKQKQFVFDNDLCEKVVELDSVNVPSQVPNLVKKFKKQKGGNNTKKLSNLRNNKSVKLRR
jgi:hypothetical protein